MSPSPNRAAAGSTDDSFASAARRRIGWILAFTAIGVLVGGVYLRLTPKKHIAVANILIERDTTGLAAAAGADIVESAIDAQAAVVRQSDVLRLAETKGQLGDLRTFAGVTDPLRIIRRDLRVERGSGRNVITVAFPSTDASDAMRVVDEVVAAFKTYQTDKQQKKSQELAGALEASRKQLVEQLEAAKRDADAAAPKASDVGVPQAAAMSEAMAKAQVDVFDTKRAYDEATTNAGAAISGLNEKELDDALRAAAANAPDSPEMISQELYAIGQQLIDLRRTYAEDHPAVQRATSRLKQMQLTQVAMTRQRWVTAQARLNEFKKIADEAQRTAVVTNTRSADQSRLNGEVTRLQTMVSELDRQLLQIKIATVAGALNISADEASVDNPAFPPFPATVPTLVTTGLIGLVLGALVALIGEYKDVGSIRHVVPVPQSAPTADRATQTLGVPVLASVPEADDGDVNTSVAWSAQLDPFGPVAASVLTMRRALEVDGKLPATMLLTAASDQQGTTSLAVNLATTIAREGRKALLIDLNFRAPAVAAEFEVDGSRGLVELINDGDPMHLIRTTSVQRLDVLATGHAPADTGAMLNDERFNRLLVMLTSAYDHVIFDAPSLARGDDARIVASVCDGTVLVSRPTPAALRRAAGARDLLLTVGANLLGIVLNRCGPITGANGGASAESDRPTGPRAVA